MRRNLILLVVTVVVIVSAFAATIVGRDRPVLGLDLQGGISIVLFPVKGSDTTALNTAVDIIRNRVDGLGIAEPEVNRQGNQVVVDLPGVKDRIKAEELVGQTAELRFRLVDNVLAWSSAQLAPTTTTRPGASTTSTSARSATTAATTATTRPASPTTAHAAARTITTTPIAAVRPEQQTTTAPATAPPTSAAPASTTTAAGATTTTTPVPTGPQTCERGKLVTKREQNVPEAPVILPSDEKDVRSKVCYVLGPALLTGKNISSARARYDSTRSGWVVDVNFKTDEFVTKVATPYVGREVAIELDGIVESAPKINPGITSRKVQIEGSFSQGRARDLALILRYGSLPVQFDKDQQTVQSVSPTLGKDQLRAGIVSGLIGLALVALYMIFFYRLLGVVVWTGLGLTALVFFALVSWLSAHQGLTLTLAGVTGIIVSVGVTVDSYVVYFERLKDEVRTGKTVRSSLETGFRRAFRTIVAADLVSMIGAVVLYLLATGSVRGFAFFLGLSTALDLVLAYCYMHPFVALLARRPALVRLRGIGIASGLDVPEVRA